MSENVEAELRWIGSDQWELYRDIRLEALRSDPSAFGSSYEEEKLYPEEVWRERVSNTLFAFADGKAVGLIGHVRQSRLSQRHIVHIVGFYVTNDHRGRGIGYLLLNGMLARIRDYGDVEKVSLVVSRNQINALNLYRKCGFKLVGELKKELKIGDSYYDELLMDLFL